MGSDLDLLLINPNGRDRIYQELGEELTAVEPPLWCRLIAGYVRDRGYSVEIIDAEAEGFGPETVADKVAARRPRLTGMIAFGHQPSASTQQMAAASPTCRAIKQQHSDIPIIIVGGHVAALPEPHAARRSRRFRLQRRRTGYVQELLDVLRGGRTVTDFTKIRRAWCGGTTATSVNNPSPPLIKDLDEGPARQCLGSAAHGQVPRAQLAVLRRSRIAPALCLDLHVAGLPV